MNFIKQPKRLLLIDVLGAFITTILLLFVLKEFNQFFGVDVSQINILATAACLVCVFGTSCLFTVTKKWKQCLLLLATLNILYCIATVVILNAGSDLTNYGKLYFFTEIVIILALAIIETKTALRLK